MMADTPGSLYSLCINAAVSDCVTNNKFVKKEFRSLPDHVLFDFYYKMYLEKRLCLLSMELGSFDIFVRMLKLKHKRTQLYQCFQALLDHGTQIADELVAYYAANYCNGDTVDYTNIDLGLRIGTYLGEGAWYKVAIFMFNLVERLCLQKEQNVQTLRKLLDCYHRRICVETSYSSFKEAEITLNLANKTVEELKKLDSWPNLAGLYSNYSAFYGMKSEYLESYLWSQKALKLLNDDLPTRVTIDVLRQGSQSCVFKRRFPQAGLLIQQAVTLAEQFYQIDQHPSFSNTLMDYGFYLLNYDNVEESVKVYLKALKIRKNVFGKNSLHVAVGYEDLAYALYVNEYSSGKFFDAKEYAEKAINIMEKILPKNHLALASTKRVKALILEEIAVDMRENHMQEIQKNILKDSLRLHESALELSMTAFGENNVQTAKHFGNLGRLYQSMSKYEKAEKMHIRAIAIKEELLGTDDYEVGLSLGHLASLYNYHMKRYREAEKLYLRSINISLKLFGDSYSGLEYDYRGLINVYTEMQDISGLLFFTQVMRDWKNSRESRKVVKMPKNPMSLQSLVDQFVNLC